MVIPARVHSGVQEAGIVAAVAVAEQAAVSNSDVEQVAACSLPMHELSTQSESRSCGPKAKC